MYSTVNTSRSVERSYVQKYLHIQGEPLPVCVCLLVINSRKCLSLNSYLCDFCNTNKTEETEEAEESRLFERFPHFARHCRVAPAWPEEDSIHSGLGIRAQDRFRVSISKLHDWVIFPSFSLHVYSICHVCTYTYLYKYLCSPSSNPQQNAVCNKPLSPPRNPIRSPLHLYQSLISRSLSGP